ncbi:MAG: 2-dehydro-3-deoxy-6-phosphogalactonate aldolase [Pseudomonadota bacterium]
MQTLSQFLKPTPLVAILRGIKPDEVIAIGEVLLETGIRIIEVPLNSPEPYQSIHRLAQQFGQNALIGAGTVTTEVELEQVAQAGGKLIVSPHTAPELIRSTKQRSLLAVPGFFTPSEAIAAIQAGADALKLFPAENAPPGILKAMRAVLPKEMPILPVGGITPGGMLGYFEAGATGFGLGSALYKPGFTPQEVRQQAEAFIAKL